MVKENGLQQTGVLFPFIYSAGFLVPLMSRNIVLAKRQKESVTIDLRTGNIRGSSKYITFLDSPPISSKQRCDSQAVLKVDLSGPFKAARFV